MMRKLISVLITSGALFIMPSQGAHAVPQIFSFSGTFNQDDDVQLFNFTTDGTTTTYIVSYAYGGGTQADGTVWEEGGFDTILSLFDSTGAHIGSNDDGDAACFAGAAGIAGSGGSADSNTGVVYDACLTALLAGDYTVALSQYDNFATGPNLSDGFSLEGAGNFTAGFSSCTQAFFCDFSDTPVYTNRTNVWAYDVLNVPSRDEGPGPGVDVPEPAALSIFSLGLLALLLRRRKPA